MLLAGRTRCCHWWGRDLWLTGPGVLGPGMPGLGVPGLGVPGLRVLGPGWGRG